MNTNGKDESYWLGVRDALRMIDSFVKWSSRNPSKNKPLEQFINEALIAASKRCESCLSHALGISFSVGEGSEPAPTKVDFFEDTSSMVKSSPLTKTLSDPDDLYFEETPSDRLSESTEHDQETAFEATLEETELPEIGDDDDYEASEESPELDIEPPSMDAFEPPKMGDTQIEFDSAERDFSLDYAIAEPEPYSVDAQPEDASASDTLIESKDESAIDSENDGFEVEIAEAPSEVDEPIIDWADEDEFESMEESEESRLEEELDRLEKDFSSHGLNISPASGDEESAGEDDEKEAESEQPKFTWHDYEESITPPPDVDASDIKPIWSSVVPKDATDEDTEESLDDPDEDHETPSVWNPYDEPSLKEHTEEDAEEEDESEEETEREKVGPPPPPPPPESDESEEERRRRARRLFFGA